MFRRKEESLFDTSTSTDSNYVQTAPNELAAAAPAQASAPTTNNSSNNNSSTGNASNASASASTSGSTAASGGISRPLPDTRPSSTQASNNFRPNASNIGTEITRNRTIPETKATAVTASSPLVEKSKSGRRVLTVGNDILLKGEIATCDRLVIEGKVDATLNDVHTVEISENGSFKGSAQIEDAEISGLFEGDLIVRNRLVIYATGKVRGKITYGEIEIERGGELTGEIKTVAASSQPNARSTRPAMKDDKVAA